MPVSKISQLNTAQQITGKMVRDAIKEAKTDPTQMDALQQVCDDRPDAFADVRAYDQLVGFLQQYYQDSFEFRDSNDNPAARMAQITEARITKVVEREQTVNMNPPAPPRRRPWRDPLNITGHAEAGAKVEFYNASQPGRPVIGDMTADPTGAFRFELTDETKFDYGDQIGIRVIDGSGKASEPVVVPTDPYQLTNTKTTYRRGSTTVRTDETSTLRALDPKHDVRNPFFQQDKVALTFRPPQNADGVHQVEIVGGDDSVEPNSTLSVSVGSETYETKADKFGKFALKVLGFEPGDELKVVVKDINGKGIDVGYTAPEVGLDMEALADAVGRPPSPRLPDSARETVGEGPPWIHFKAADVTVPFGAVMLKNTSTDEVYELNADENGRINAAVGGIDNFDVIEVVARDASGNVGPDAEVFVMLPEKVKRGAPFFMPSDELTQKQPDVSSVVEAIQGPPQDLFINGKRDPRGPFLKMPDVSGMPPFGQLAVVREGKVIQYLRADKGGKLQGLLRGVNVGDQLNFRVLDAAGRKFPMELAGWNVPGAGQTSEVPKKHTHADDRTVADCLEQIGKGELDLRGEWLEPFSLKSGQIANPQTSVPLNYNRQFFGADAADRNEASFDFFPPALLKEHGLNLSGSNLQLDITENQGTTRMHLTRDGSQLAQPLGVDYVMGRVNLGDPNQPILVPDSLPQLTQNLRAALSFVALAYDQGKEPGDMSYDRAMAAVKTVLYVFDRVAVENPDQKDAIVAAAKEAIPDGGFRYELTGRYKVPPKGAEESGVAASEARSGAMSVLAARTAQMGAVAGVGQVGPSDGVAPPTIESASVLVGRKDSRSQRRSRVGVAPLRVAGSAEPGDIVQVYNVSSGVKTLLAESTVGPDGKFQITSGADVMAGDQLGVVSLTSDGKKSAMMVVPTDTYELQNVHQAHTAKPVRVDDRPPFLRLGETKLENKTFGADGKARDGGPFWQLSGGELSVEPFSSIEVTSTMPDGSKRTASAEVDGQGQFSLEFAAGSRARVGIKVTDKNGRSQNKAHLTTPGLAVSLQTGDDAAAANIGKVTFNLPGGVAVDGIIVASTMGQGVKYDEVQIQQGDRHDDFVDVVIHQKFAYTAENGQEGHNEYNFRIKIAKEDAEHFTANFGEKVEVDMPGMQGMDVPGNWNGAAPQQFPSGRATIRDRDFGAINGLAGGADPATNVPAGDA
jgi:hypothetical protein